MLKSICLISYKFPPMPGVGAKRWAKFSKHLADRGYCIHVITSNYSNKESISWLKDINHKNIILHNLDSKLPDFVLYGKKSKYYNFVRRIWRFYHYRIKKRLDDADSWSQSIVSYVENLIEKESIKTLFVTGAPFSQFVSAAIIKTDFPNLKLVVDYRDAWNFLSSYQYKNGFFKTLSDKRKSINNEEFVLRSSNKITFVTRGLMELYMLQYPTYMSKMEFLYSGFESQDDSNTDIQMAGTEGKILFPGNLGFSRLHNLEEVARAIDKLNDKYSLKHYNIYVYTDFIVPFENKYNCLKVQKRIGVDEIQLRMREADFCLSINADEFDYAVSAKVFDFMANKKRIIHISRGGELSEFLFSKNQVVIDSTDSNEYLFGLERIYTENIEIADYTEMEIRNSIDQLEKVINGKL